MLCGRNPDERHCSVYCVCVCVNGSERRNHEPRWHFLCTVSVSWLYSRWRGGINTMTFSLDRDDIALLFHLSITAKYNMGFVEGQFGWGRLKTTCVRSPLVAVDIVIGPSRLGCGWMRQLQNRTLPRGTAVSSFLTCPTMCVRVDKFHQTWWGYYLRSWENSNTQSTEQGRC